jgi:hypothetical protein
MTARAAGLKLDSAFGAGGKVVTDFGNNDFGESILILPDGKILLVGSCWGPTGYNIALVI